MRIQPSANVFPTHKKNFIESRVAFSAPIRVKFSFQVFLGNIKSMSGFGLTSKNLVSILRASRYVWAAKLGPQNLAVYFCTW